jgi:hypothetical protein
MSNKCYNHNNAYFRICEFGNFYGEKINFGTHNKISETSSDVAHLTVFITGVNLRGSFVKLLGNSSAQNGSL